MNKVNCNIQNDKELEIFAFKGRPLPSIEDSFNSYSNTGFLITNLDAKYEHLFREALKVYSNSDLYIVKDIYDDNGDKIEDTISLRCKKRSDLSDFWKIVGKLEDK